MANIVLGEFKPTYNERQASQQRYLDQLASGKRITTASVDASSLAIGSKLSSDSATLSVSASNASTSQALLNVANSGLEGASSILEQLKSLATLAQSGTVTNTDLDTINDQFASLKSELDAIATKTSFNGQKLLDGSFASGVDVALGSGTGETVNISLNSITSTALGLNGTDLLTPANANAALDAIDTAIATIASNQSQVGATQAKFAFSADIIAASKENTDASLSTLLDSDVGESFTAQTAASALSQATIASIEHANANRRHLLALLQ